MNHPKHEEWVPYLFGETSWTSNRELNAHLRSCPECREEIEGWKSSLGRLNAWKLPPVRTAGEMFQPMLKWGVAAALVLGLGIGMGRLTVPKADAAAVRAAIEPVMRQEVARLMRDELAKAASQRAEDNEAIYAAMDKLDAQRIADLLSLKKELDTVAVNTDAGLRHTEQELVQLAGYTQPASASSLPEK
jgi:hypothetical protein